MPCLKYVLLCLIVLSGFNAIKSQDLGDAYIYGSVKSRGGEPLPGASVYIKEDIKTSTVSNAKGQFVLKLESAKNHTLQCSYLSFKTFTKKIRLNTGDSVKIKIRLLPDAKIIDSVVVEEKKRVNEIMISIDQIEALPGTMQSAEGVLKTMGVSSNNETSSQYSVRGGNYDENLVYVNDFVIYRSQLVRSGLQEGMSFINSDMLSSLRFFPGGFNAEYGDKMSSVLDVRYKRPKEYATTISGSFLGGSVYTQGIAMDQRMRYLFGARYQTNQYLLNSMDVGGTYRPSFYDIQSYLSWDLSDRWELSLLNYYSKNDFRMVPETQSTKFGGIQQVLNFKVYFEGQEVNRYETAMGGIALKHYDPKKNYYVKWMASAFKSKEDETFDVIGEYWLSAVDMDFGSEDFGQDLYSLGVGTFHNFARNYLDILVANTELKGGFELGSHFFQWGAKYQREEISDTINEWMRLDSAGYSLAYSTDQVLLYNVLKTGADLSSSRFSGYLQDRWIYTMKDTGLLTVTGGLRYQYWDLNDELLISPRFQLSYRPKWRRNITLYTANGVYYQPAFYRELRDQYGNVNTNIKAQRSIHLTAGSEVVLKAWGRRFRFATDLYYKFLDNLIPYEVDNVRIRYYAENIAKGYATGIDLRLHGEFVQDAESWLSLSILKTQEDIEGDFYYNYYDTTGQKVNPFIVSAEAIADSQRVEPGFIPRPTDQRVNFGMYFQDYLPGNKNFKMHLNFLFGTGFKFGPPDFSRYKDTLNIPPYRRVDLGFSALLLDGKKERVQASKWGKHFRSIWASLEIFNLLQVSNTVSYIWVRDIGSTQYAVPNFLTSRRINLRLIAKF